VRERTQALEQEVASARERTQALEQEVASARERAQALEREVASARERTQELERAASNADTRAAQATPDRASASRKAQLAQIFAEEVRKRLAGFGKAIREARARATEPTEAAATETSRSQEAAPTAPENATASREAPPPPTSPIVASLTKYAGTRAAVFVLDEARDARAIGATISGYLGDAGWTPQSWSWAGVSGILGVVVLVKLGSDPATNEAASALLNALRSAGLNVTKGDWPADWRRYRGTLIGPETPGPTEAPIRIVIGAKAR
jgi:hypothetical protein